MGFDISPEQQKEFASASVEFTPVPDGKYCATLFDVEDCERTARNGNELAYVKCHWKLEGGQYSNRREFDDIVYSNSGSEQHGSIGQQQLAKLFAALGGTGRLNFAALSSLVGKKVELVIKTTETGKPDYPTRRNLYYNPCKEDCNAGAPANADSSDDIWT